MENITEQIVSFSRQTTLADASNTTQHILKLSLLDWCAVALAGAAEPASQITRQMLNSEAGTAESTIIGQSARLPARAAALANGTTSHTLDYDDTHFLHIGHPAVVIFSAALAVAERQGSTGADFLTAALVGYESSCRIGQWLGRSHYEAGFHQTATAGCFGATLAACRLLDLSRSQTGHALGLASTRASGLKAQFGSMGKPYNAGIAAANGVEVALLAAAGFTSNPDALDGALGFSQTHAGASTEPAINIGDPFVLEQVHHKFHACCHGLHAMLEALRLAITAQPRLDQQITELTIHTHPRWLKVCNIPAPQFGLEAKFSYRQVAAMTMAGISTARLDSFQDGLCADPKLAELRKLVRVVDDATLADTATRIEIRCKDGGKTEFEFDLATPLPAQTREARVREKAATLVGETKSNALWDQIESLEKAENLQDLVHLLKQ